MMNGMVCCVLYFPRYMMITGITLLALAFCMPELRAMEKPDFEKLLADRARQKRAGRCRGLDARRTTGRVHVEFRRHDQRRPGLPRQRHLQAVHQSEFVRRDRRLDEPRRVDRRAGGRHRRRPVGRRGSPDVMLWITGALYSGYVMANVLKWIWWRFNGYGYFWGMMAGILGAMLIPEATVKVSPAVLLARQSLKPLTSNPIYLVPVLLVLSLAGCLLGTYLSTPEDKAILKHFYRTTRPWGFWGPIRDEIMREDPSFEPNRDFGKDAINVIVGIVWQTCLTALPIFLVLRHGIGFRRRWRPLVVTSMFIKFNWYDKLPAAEAA